jgi:DNA-3-methyladenine glycosylase
MVARELLGKKLVRLEDERALSGVILEVEAYRGEEDLASHARAGFTPRTKIMYGSPGTAYVYFTYGMHWMLNFVTEGKGFPAAVLIRSLYPTQGQEVIAERRSGQPPARWTDGPAKLCQALGIDGSFNGADLCAEDGRLFVEDADPVADSSVSRTPRVGINSVPEPWKSMPWRLVVKADEDIGEM